MKVNNAIGKIRYGTCSKDCYGSCVFRGVWDDKAPEYKFVSANPLKDHPFTQGFFCPKYKKRENLLYHQDRLKEPLMRDGPKAKNIFKPISSEVAFDIISEKILTILEKKSSNSIIAAFYAGNSGLISRYAPLRFFGNIMATITRGGICNEGGCTGLADLFGTYSITNPFQLGAKETNLIVIWGSNLSESNIHAYNFVKHALRNGTKLIVIDSRRTKIAEKAHKFLHIYPSTEHLLAKLILNELITHNAYDDNFLRNHVNSYESIFQEVKNINKVKLLDQTGVKRQNFHDFVDFLIEFKHHTIFNIGYGIQKDFFGGRMVRTIALIQIMLGNIGKSGTGIIYSQSDFLNPLIQPLQNYITKINEYEKINEIPLINLGSELLSDNYQLLFIYNFNPASSLPNQNQLREALLRENLFVIVLDMFLNETTKYADIVIPVKFDLESHDLISSYYIPSLSINIGGPCSYQYCMSNYEFFQKLAIKIGYGNLTLFQEKEEEIFNYCLNMLPQTIQKELKDNGYYIHFNRNFVPFENLEFPSENNQIRTLGPHFKFGSKVLTQRLERNKNEFLLLTPAHPHLLHSQLKQLHLKFITDFDHIFLPLKDTNNLNLTTGDRVLVSNNYGSAEYNVMESTSLKSGTALIYSGLSSSLKGHANANLFISEKPEELGLSGAYNSAIVKVSKINF